MAKKPNPGIPSSGNTTPTLPVTTPAAMGHDNWTLQALNQLTGTVGRLEVAIDSLKDCVVEIKTEQSDIGKRLNKVETKIVVSAAVVSVLIVVLSIVGTLLGYVGNKAIDFGLDMAKARLNEAPIAAPQVPPPPPIQQKQ